MRMLILSKLLKARMKTPSIVKDNCRELCTCSPLSAPPRPPHHKTSFRRRKISWTDPVNKLVQYGGKRNRTGILCYLFQQALDGTNLVLDRNNFSLLLLLVCTFADTWCCSSSSSSSRQQCFPRLLLLAIAAVCHSDTSLSLSPSLLPSLQRLGTYYYHSNRFTKTRTLSDGCNREAGKLSLLPLASSLLRSVHTHTKI